MADKAINADDVDIPSVNFAQQSSDVAAPAAGRWQLFFKATGLWVITNGATAFRLAKHVMTAAGDLTVGGAAGVETRLAMGAALQHLRVNAGATALEFADPAVAPENISCSLTTNATKVVHTTSWTAVDFQVETYDNGGMHEGVTNPSRITIPAGQTGYYTLSVSLAFPGNATGRRLIGYKLNAGSWYALVQEQPNSISNVLAFSFDFSLAAGDYLEVGAYQESGGDLTLASGATLAACHKWA